MTTTEEGRRWPEYPAFCCSCSRSCSSPRRAAATATTTADAAATDGEAGGTTTTAATDTTDTGGPAEGPVGTASSEFGEILVDGEGRTLYVFMEDSEGESACADACLETWPPLTAGEGEVEVADGLDASLFGTLEGNDGSTQVMVDGRPLYTYAGDQAPGDVTGQGIGDVWWVVAPDGSPVEEAPSGGGSDTTEASAEDTDDADDGGGVSRDY
ncbi:MAG: hypothetical protein U5R31_06125 [Acidimicrobiia bacterium]|nr:hypothetical protein [Acidimicrobiia bacterium]